LREKRKIRKETRDEARNVAPEAKAIVWEQEQDGVIGVAFVTAGIRVGTVVGGKEVGINVGTGVAEMLASVGEDE
jgi:hypothetical protein